MFSIYFQQFFNSISTAIRTISRQWKKNYYYQQDKTPPPDQKQRQTYYKYWNDKKENTCKKKGHNATTFTQLRSKNWIYHTGCHRKTSKITIWKERTKIKQHIKSRDCRFLRHLKYAGTRVRNFGNPSPRHKYPFTVSLTNNLSSHDEW